MPARKAESLKQLAGTVRPDRQRMAPQPQRLTRAPRPPADLPEAARPYWRRLAKTLTSAGVLTAADLPALGDLALVLLRVRQAEDAVTEHGLVVPGRAGGLVKNPAATLGQQYRAAALRLLSKFGMLPADRGAVQIVPEVAPELEDLLGQLANMAGAGPALIGPKLEAETQED